METHARMPGLALPFAVVGAAAGWLAAGFLAEPLVRVSIGGNQPQAAVCAAVTAALLGYALRRWCGRVDPFRPPHAVHVRVFLAVVVGGAISGALTEIVVGRDWVHYAALEGALASLPFIPICGAVVFAARRAERARHGSIVAAADAR